MLRCCWCCSGVLLVYMCVVLERGLASLGGGFSLNAFVVFYCNAPERSRPFPTECFGMGDEPSTIGRAGSPDHAAEWREPCDLPQPIVHGLHSAGGYGEATNQ